MAPSFAPENADDNIPSDKRAADKAVELGELGLSIGFLLHIAQLVTRENEYTLIKDIDDRLSLGEFIVLKAISLNPGIAQGVLADLYRITWPSMSRLVAGMEKRKLLTRIVFPEDRRSVGLSLTGEGERLVERQSALMNSVNEVVFAQFNSEEKSALVSALRKIIDWQNVK